MDNRSAEAHLLAWLRVGVERVVVAVQTVQMWCLEGSLEHTDRIWGAIGWRREVGNLGTYTVLVQLVSPHLIQSSR